jgi:hypothetical protein
MKPRQVITFSLSLLLLLNCKTQFAQAGGSDDSDNHAKGKTGKGFHFGLFVGSLFANKYTANLYDGYGIDADGFKHDFTSSDMNRKINFEYGGGNGLPDRIAPALNCNPGEWTFDQTDMPVNMKYTPAISVGLEMRYGMTSRDAIILNANGTKLTATGDFTIVVNQPQIGIVVPNSIRTFPIIGGEQRLVLQLGYQRILGDNDKLNCFLEGGATFSMAKFDQNIININGLVIDLSTYYNTLGNVEYHAKNLTGVGFGAFAGFGINLAMSPKWTVQLVYDPSLEKINIGQGPEYTLQHSVGLRAYYVL